MDKRSIGLLALAGAVLAAAAGMVAAQTSGPIARYEMRAGTTSGFGGMAGMRGGGMGAMMGMGGRSAPQHELLLELGSSRAATGAPKADHFMPAGARLGVSVALKSPVKAPDGPDEPEVRDFQRPKGRMLIFWGCSEHAPAGQPVVIDFAKLAAGQMPPGLWSSAVPRDRTVSPQSSKTYGSWPSDDGKSVKPESSLLGEHRIASSYAPPISFTLTKDFMGALSASSMTQPSGATLLRWNPLMGATGFHASLFGGKQGPGGAMADIVWWSSSATREFGGGLSDWLSPATVARLVTSKTVLGPQIRTCLVPAEVKAAAPQFQMATLSAYGPEEDFAFPPRPADPKAPWKLEWTARIRHRSTTSLFLGMPGMDGMGDGEDPRYGRRPPSDCQQKPKRRGLGGLGGLMGGMLGGGSGGDENGC